MVNNRGGDFMHVMKLVDMNFLFPKMIGVDLNSQVISFRPCLVATSATSVMREFCLHIVLNEVYLQNLFIDGCIFSRRI